MKDEWLYQVDGKVHGPVSQEVLARKCREGEIKPTDLIKNPDGNWVEPSAGLFPFEVWDAAMREKARRLQELEEIEERREPALRRAQDWTEVLARSPLITHPVLTIAFGVVLGMFIWTLIALAFAFVFNAR